MPKAPTSSSAVPSGHSIRGELPQLVEAVVREVRPAELSLDYGGGNAAHEPLDRLVEMARDLLGALVTLVSPLKPGQPLLTSPSAPSAPSADALPANDLGIDPGQSLLEHLRAREALPNDSPLIIEDAWEDDRTRDNPALRGEAVRGCCIVALLDVRGQSHGFLVAISPEPRPWPATQVRLLQRLAEAAMEEVELRSAVDRLTVRKARLAAEAEKANAAIQRRDRFIAMIGHELRNSMSPALMAVQLLEMDDRLPEPLRDEVATIRRGIDDEQRLVGDLLDITRAARGQMRIERRPVTLATVLVDVVEDQRPEASQAGVGLEMNVDADCPPIHADPGRLRQLVLNLVGNAIKFTDADGLITVSAGPTLCGSVHITVTDTGRGMEPSAIATLFDPFVQEATPRVSATPTAHNRGGLGLGLAICRSIAEAHGGSLHASSPGLGLGSTFRVELPIMPVQ